MRHLTPKQIEQAGDLAGPTEEQKRHLERCNRCRGLLNVRKILRQLKAAGARERK